MVAAGSVTDDDRSSEVSKRRDAVKALLTPVPSAPNPYAAALCQGEYAGLPACICVAGIRLC
jgi:hypothetical protein